MNAEDRMIIDLAEAHTTIDIQNSQILQLKLERDYYKNKSYDATNNTLSWCVVVAIVTSTTCILISLI